MNKIELHIGDTVYVENEEYIIVFYRRTKDYMGNSLELHARDPLLAQEMKENGEVQRRLLKKSEQVLDMGIEEK